MRGITYDRIFSIRGRIRDARHWACLLDHIPSWRNFWLCWAQLVKLLLRYWGMGDSGNLPARMAGVWISDRQITRSGAQTKTNTRKKKTNMSEQSGQQTGIGRELFDHKNNKYNREHIVIKTADERADDNAHHKYVIEAWIPQLVSPGPAPQMVERCEISFQNGGLKEVGPNGITDQALLAVVLDRLRSFNDGPYRSRENSMMITKLEEVLMWGEKRGNDRARRGVEGERKE